MDEKNTVKSINGMPVEDTEARAAAASKIGKDELGTAVEEALTQAKESGEFDGEDGQPGTTPHIGANGNWYIGETDTGVKAQGEDGTPGITPHIGENGNWFLGDTDTGVKAQGPVGPAGSDYILTEADKTEIAETAADIVDDALSEVIGDPDGAVPAVPGYMALGMTGAAVGMVARIKSVDADGKPTAWEPVEMASGGGSGGAVSEMVGATAETAGAAGLVPAPAAGDNGKVLFGDGTWGEIPSGGDWTRLEREFTYEGGESGVKGNFKLTPSLLCEEDFVEAFVYVWVQDTAGSVHRLNYTGTKVDYRTDQTVPATGMYYAYHAVKVDNSVIISSLDSQNIHKRFAYTTDVTNLEKTIGFWIHWSEIAAGETITSRGVIVYR